MMRRFLLWFGLVSLVGLTGLGLASGSGDGPMPSAVALAHGYPPGLYSEAEFSISDDAVVMVLQVSASLPDQSSRRSMQLYGDGRLEIEAGEEAYTRKLERPRMLKLFRQAVDHGLAEYDSDVAMEETKAASGPVGRESVAVSLRFESYQRGSVEGPLSVRARLYSPESFPQVVQSRALVDLVAALDAEIATARREGSIEFAPKALPYERATFQMTSDPNQLILKWRFGSGMGRGSRSMMLFGDGRLELKSEGSKRGSEKYSRELTFAEMESLLRLVVDHGLAEWDRSKVWAAVAAVGGGLARRMTDAGGMAGEIHLDSYRRGSYTRSPLVRSFEFRNVQGTLREAPGVLELQGLDALSDFAVDQLRLAREGGNDE